MRLKLALGDRAEWVKVFDPRAGGLFVATPTPPAVGDEVRVDLTLGEGGPRVILRGTVTWRRSASEDEAKNPPGCAVALSIEDREKINFLNGYVRGGLLNRREKRRLPLRLPVTYAGDADPVAATTRDVNEEGAFVVTSDPLAEGSAIKLVLTIPGRGDIAVSGQVSHTVIVDDGDVPGMGVRFTPAEGQQADLLAMVDELEKAFLAGTLPVALID